MTIRMTPIRWGLITLAAATGMYVVFLFTASNPDGDWLIPQQINSVILSGLGYTSLFMALAEFLTRRDRRRDAERHESQSAADPHTKSYIQGFTDGLAARPGDATVSPLVRRQ